VRRFLLYDRRRNLEIVVNYYFGGLAVNILVHECFFYGRGDIYVMCWISKRERGSGDVCVLLGRGRHLGVWGEMPPFKELRGLRIMQY
jgi:hypothetical protein